MTVGRGPKAARRECEQMSAWQVWREDKGKAEGSKLGVGSFGSFQWTLKYKSHSFMYGSWSQGDKGKGLCVRESSLEAAGGCGLHMGQVCSKEGLALGCVPVAW